MSDNFMIKFRRIFRYSEEKNQIANVKKTVYGNFSKNPRLTPLEVDNNIVLNSIDPIKGYKYIGLSVYPTNDITEIIQRNINKRMMNFAKFHAWLSVNELTPIEVKYKLMIVAYLELCYLHLNAGVILHVSRRN